MLFGIVVGLSCILALALYVLNLFQIRHFTNTVSREGRGRAAAAAAEADNATGKRGFLVRRLSSLSNRRLLKHKDKKYALKTMGKDSVHCFFLNSSTAGLPISYKVGRRWNADITRSDFKSEAIFGFLSPNYICHSTSWSGHS